MDGVMLSNPERRPRHTVGTAALESADCIHHLLPELPRLAPRSDVFDLWCLVINAEIWHNAGLKLIGLLDNVGKAEGGGASES